MNAKYRYHMNVTLSYLIEINKNKKNVKLGSGLDILNLAVSALAIF